MATAHIKRPDGTSIVIKGDPHEIAEVVRKIQGEGPAPDKKGRARVRQVSTGKSSLPDILISLLDGGFFKKPKELAAVKTALAELGHVYPVTTVAPALLRLVRRRHLRRIKQDKRWFYTGHPQ